MNIPTAAGAKHRILRLINPSAGRLEAELRVERDRITRLEQELDELRRDSLRVAELVDLVEQRLTPGSN